MEIKVSVLFASVCLPNFLGRTLHPLLSLFPSLSWVLSEPENRESVRSLVKLSSSSDGRVISSFCQNYISKLSCLCPSFTQRAMASIDTRGVNTNSTHSHHESLTVSFPFE